jgi:WD40 repeat protein
MPNQCEQLKQEYNNLKSLKQEFDLEYEKAVETRNTARAKELKIEIERKIAELKEKLWNIKWKLYNPRELEFVIKKEKYKNIETLEGPEGHKGSVLTLQVLPDGRIVSGGSDSTIKIWEKDQVGKYQNTETLTGYNDWVLTLQVLPDGRIVSGSDDKTIKIWDGEKV